VLTPGNESQLRIAQSKLRTAAHWTTTVSVMLLLKLPDCAVMVALYVPAGVPSIVCEVELPPPHPANTIATATIAMPDSGLLRSLRRNKLQVGSGVTTGASVHARFTVPLNPNV
jgi:hypothetical protein